jgi:hypothetical protein
MHKIIKNSLKQIAVFMLFFTSPIFIHAKTAVFIVGIGRCGSSCLTGVLHIMGLPLGDNLLPANALNPTGFFEQWDMLKLNKTILKELGTEYLEGKKTRYVRWNKEPRFMEFKNVIKENLAMHFKDQPFFGLKDPRLSMLLALYTAAAHELDYDVKTIFIIRNPEESMASWQDAGPFARLSKEDILKKFTIYLTSMLAHLKEQERSDYLVIQYEDLLDDTQKEVTRIGQFIPELSVTDQTRRAIAQFVDVGLNHHAKANIRKL